MRTWVRPAAVYDTVHQLPFSRGLASQSTLTRSSSSDSSPAACASAGCSCSSSAQSLERRLERRPRPRPFLERGLGVLGRFTADLGERCGG